MGKLEIIMAERTETTIWAAAYAQGAKGQGVYFMELSQPAPLLVTPEFWARARRQVAKDRPGAVLLALTPLSALPPE
jgi:hypothetical protein